MTSFNRKFLIFSMQNSLYALDLEQVAEVGDRPQMSPIPLVPIFFSGALNFHGEIVAVMNLALFLGLPWSEKPGKIVVLHQDVASLAFLVDSVVRIVSENEITFCSAPDVVFTTATLGLSDGEAIQLDLDALVREAENVIQRR